MCLIIENKTNIKLQNLLSKEQVVSFAEQNPDGFGITFFKNNRINTIKNFGVDNFLNALNFVESDKQKYYIHFRKATIGKVCLNNIHPFDIHGNGKLFLMHNGELPGFKSNEKSLNFDYSDTYLLANEIKRLLKENHKLQLLNKDFKLDIEKQIGNGRAVLISSSTAIIFNEVLWITHENGLKFSKKINN